MKIVFIILHYNNFLCTCECIESIKNTQSSYDYKIVIVDNGSKNDSGKEIEKKYRKYKNIKIILNKENFGFSKGNNIGCEYAIKNFNPEFLFVINNDIIVKTPNIYAILKKKYEKQKFDVAGSNIWNVNKKYNHNPCFVISNLKEAKKELKSFIIQEKFCRWNIYFFYVLYIKIKKLLLKKFLFKNKLNKGLHGSALIFSRSYINKYKKIFPEKTFLYGEENFLNYRRVRDKLVFSYIYKILLYHKESVVTKQKFKSRNKKWKFQILYMKYSREILLKLYLNLEKCDIENEF
ncbi:glycosyltransferase [Fusobacterium varium]|uniref:glycosyltransferase family 2 protein n=1 Tax=Fusobacterium varium TaxID=856 RepID=UPI002FF299CB